MFLHNLLKVLVHPANEMGLQKKLSEGIILEMVIFLNSMHLVGQYSNWLQTALEGHQNYYHHIQECI
jgi:hypothetical protein